jgi:hypothetical protein
VGKLEGKSVVLRVGRGWRGIIKMDLQEVGCWGTDWIDLAKKRDR